MNPDSSDPQQRIRELEELLAHRERQIEAMRLAGDAVFAQASTDEMVRETLTLAIRVLRGESGSLQLYDPSQNALVFRYVIGPAAETLKGYAMPASEGIAGQVFKSGTPDLSHQVRLREEFNPLIDETTGYRTESMLTVAVKRPSGQPIGVMQVLNIAGEDAPFDERDLEVLGVLSSQAALAIENARLLNEARKAEIVNLIGDISHDIKNLLTPIQSGAWTLRDLLDDSFKALEQLAHDCPHYEKWGAKITKCIEPVRGDYGWILDNALDAADKVQARTSEIADAVKGEISPPFFEISDLNETAYQVARSLALVGQKAGVALFLDLDPHLPRAQFDRKQIYNALYNLVNNAVPETPRGGGVTLSTRHLEADNLILIQVRDNGRGMSEAVRTRLFSDQTISTKPGGTGLGTRIVANVIRRHKAEIRVESEPNQGTTFTIRLPLRQS